LKTKPVKPNPNTYVINFVSTSQLLTEKVRSFFSHSRAITITCSESPLTEDGLDCYVVPFRSLRTLFGNPDRPDTWLPVIAYGDRLVLGEAFAFGCRDFLKDPWDLSELDIRIDSVRRASAVEAAAGGLTLVGNRLQGGDAVVLLKPNEARIIKALLKARGEVVSREVLYYAIWGTVKNSSSRVVDVHISALRRKLRGLTNLSITQVRGEGYQLT
jgi:hypothetical protein